MGNTTRDLRLRPLRAVRPALGRALAVLGCAVLVTGCGASLPADPQAGLVGGPDQKAAAGLSAVAPGAGPAAGGLASAGGASTGPVNGLVGAPIETAGVARTADMLTAAAKPGAAGYKIGPLDVLEVSVFKVPELSKSVQVAETGSINLPLLGEVSAAGKTAQEIERDLTRQLGAKYLQNPQVTVYVKEFNSQRVTVEGAVKKPGVYPIRGHSTLLQFLATAEGLDKTSDQGVIVFRNKDGQRTAAKFDVSEIRAGAAPDPQVQSGDVIVASSSAMKEAFENLMKAMPAAGLFALL